MAFVYLLRLRIWKSIPSMFQRSRFYFLCDSRLLSLLGSKSKSLRRSRSLMRVRRSVGMELFPSHCPIRRNGPFAMDRAKAQLLGLSLSLARMGGVHQSGCLRKHTACAHDHFGVRSALLHSRLAICQKWDIKADLLLCWVSRKTMQLRGMQV